jgi:predicted DNA-binding antitoxin AbrB/MazE fold protein
MSVISVEAEYDGRVLVPRQPLDLRAGQQVRLIITEIPPNPGYGSWKQRSSTSGHTLPAAR